MRKLLKSLFEPSREVTARAEKEQAQLDKVSESHRLFIEAATGTMSLAGDVTSSLRDRIDDYTNQIEATSQVIPDALILVGADGKIENVNNVAETIFGIQKTELVGRNITDIFRSTDQGEVSIAKFKKLFATVSNSFELVRRGNLEIKGIKWDGSEFDPNIKVSEFTRADGTIKHMLLVQDITDAIEAEKRFMAVFDQQAATLKALPDILIIVDFSYNIVRVTNSSVYDTFLVETDMGKSLKDLLSENNFRLFAEHMLNISIHNSLESWTFHVEHDNGTTTYYEARASQCGNNVLIIMRDETDVVITREELLESEEHFRMFGQASSEAMMLHNTKKVLDWNPRLGEMTGYSSNEISQMNPIDFFHPMERSRIKSENNCNKAYTSLFTTKMGNSIEVAINERLVDWKGEEARIAVIRDITHLKNVEHILHLSRERYKSITENTFDVVCCYGSDLKLTFNNQTFADYFHKPVEPDTSLLEAIDPRDHHRVRNHLAAIDIYQPVKRTVHRVSYNGETRWLDWIDRAVYDTDGNFLEFHGVGRDVTDYIKRSKELMN
jgi:PAS domain S-box-containing protein